MSWKLMQLITSWHKSVKRHDWLLTCSLLHSVGLQQLSEVGIKFIPLLKDAGKLMRLQRDAEDLYQMYHGV